MQQTASETAEATRTIWEETGKTYDLPSEIFERIAQHIHAMPLGSRSNPKEI